MNGTDDFKAWFDQTLSDICSGDSHKVWRAACAIIESGQYKERIVPFVEYLALIRERVWGIELGGFVAPNKRFVDFALRTIEFHQIHNRCPCCLYLEHAVDPKKEDKRALIRIDKVVLLC